MLIVSKKDRLDMVKFLLKKWADINDIGLKDYGDDIVTVEKVKRIAQGSHGGIRRCYQIPT